MEHWAISAFLFNKIDRVLIPILLCPDAGLGLGTVDHRGYRRSDHYSSDRRTTNITLIHMIRSILELGPYAPVFEDRVEDSRGSLQSWANELARVLCFELNEPRNKSQAE